MRAASLSEIARTVGGELHGPADRSIRSVAPLERATETDLSFVANPRYLVYLQGTRAGGVLIPRSLEAKTPASVPRIVVDDARVALFRALSLLYPEEGVEPGVHPTAVIEEGATLGEGVSIGAYAVIGQGTVIGPRTRIGAQVVIGPGCRVGSECTVHPHASLYAGVVVGDRCVIHSGARLGREGFGFVWLDGGHRKMPQLGGCVLGDDVEVGTNVTIDRGSIDDTVVGAGTKIDSLVHLGHNVRLGSHVILVAQVGISGSSSVGDGAVLGGQAGVGEHLSIGARARVGGQAGVTADVPAGETVSGYPARPHREAMRAQASLFRLPSLVRRLRELERVVFGKSRE